MNTYNNTRMKRNEQFQNLLNQPEYKTAASFPVQSTEGTYNIIILRSY